MSRYNRGCRKNGFLFFFFFFFKQKTAYELLRGLVGSELCIRDRFQVAAFGTAVNWADALTKGFAGPRHRLLAAALGLGRDH